MSCPCLLPTTVLSSPFSWVQCVEGVSKTLHISRSCLAGTQDDYDLSLVTLPCLFLCGCVCGCGLYHSISDPSIPWLPLWGVMRAGVIWPPTSVVSPSDLLNRTLTLLSCGCSSETPSVIVSASPQCLLQWELKNNPRSKRTIFNLILLFVGTAQRTHLPFRYLPRLVLISFVPIDGRVVQGRQVWR